MVFNRSVGPCRASPVKEELKNEIDYCGSQFNFININDAQFKTKINEIYNKRKNVLI